MLGKLSLCIINALSLIGELRGRDDATSEEIQLAIDIEIVIPCPFARGNINRLPFQIKC